MYSATRIIARVSKKHKKIKKIKLKHFLNFQTEQVAEIDASLCAHDLK